MLTHNIDQGVPDSSYVHVIARCLYSVYGFNTCAWLVLTLPDWNPWRRINTALVFVHILYPAFRKKQWGILVFLMDVEVI